MCVSLSSELLIAFVYVASIRPMGYRKLEMRLFMVVLVRIDNDSEVRSVCAVML